MSYTNTQLQTDSLEYEILEAAAIDSLKVPGASVELGVREGGGSEIIVRAQFTTEIRRPHIAVDPWGDILYQERDDTAPRRLGYSDAMRRRCSAGLHRIARDLNADVLIFAMTDADFFTAFQGGVPFYTDGGPQTITQYSLVHFDGPHARHIIMPEIEFFASRTPIGGYWVFDDIMDYDHDTVEGVVLSKGFVRSDSPLNPDRGPYQRKASYVRAVYRG
jgi:hypothetical protein